MDGGFFKAPALSIFVIDEYNQSENTDFVKNWTAGLDSWPQC